ncbi:hypothetical protein [Bacterioplanoides sp.]|uniref:hypothetical protein n=1 Tax=Bacterioplanoides sp. TaxID=2066072 RepID=UPI003B5CD192
MNEQQKSNDLAKPDCYTIQLTVEYLPGMKLISHASIEFSDEDIARKSLAHIQKKYPEAQLSSQAWLDDSDELNAWRDETKRRTDLIREQLDALTPKDT